MTAAVFTLGGFACLTLVTLVVGYFVHRGITKSDEKTIAAVASRESIPRRPPT